MEPTTKTFDDQLRAAFEAGERRARAVLRHEDPAPDFDEWRPTLGDPA